MATPRPAMVAGDTTTHGGTVLEGESTILIGDKKVARKGDPVACPKCKGTFPIVEGTSHAWLGHDVAVDGMRTGCGAQLIASQRSVLVGWDPQPADPTRDFNRHFVLQDARTGEPLATRPYVLAHPDGTTRFDALAGRDGETRLAQHTQFGDADLYAHVQYEVAV